MKCLFFRLIGTLYTNYLRVVKSLAETLLCCAYRLNSNYRKFTALHKLISVVYNWRIKSSKNFPRNHAVLGLFFFNCPDDEVLWILQVLCNFSEQFIFKLNTFYPNVPFLYPLRTSENHWFSDVFSGYRNGTFGYCKWVENWNFLFYRINLIERLKI